MPGSVTGERAETPIKTIRGALISAVCSESILHHVYLWGELCLLSNTKQVFAAALLLRSLMQLAYCIT